MIKEEIKELESLIALRNEAIRNYIKERDEYRQEIASLKEQLEESSSLVKDSFEIICMTCTKRSNIDNRIKVQAWLKKARATQARREN